MCPDAAGPGDARVVGQLLGRHGASRVDHQYAKQPALGPRQRDRRGAGSRRARPPAPPRPPPRPPSAVAAQREGRPEPRSRRRWWRWQPCRAPAGAPPAPAVGTAARGRHWPPPRSPAWPARRPAAPLRGQQCPRRRSAPGSPGTPPARRGECPRRPAPRHPGSRSGSGAGLRPRCAPLPRAAPSRASPPAISPTSRSHSAEEPCASSTRSARPEIAMPTVHNAGRGHPLGCGPVEVAMRPAPLRSRSGTVN